MADNRLDNVSDEARKLAVAWGEAKNFDMLDTFKLGMDIQQAINLSLKEKDKRIQELENSLLEMTIQFGIRALQGCEKPHDTWHTFENGNGEPVGKKMQQVLNKAKTVLTTK